MVATVEQLAALVRGRLVGDGSVSIHSARPVGEAGPGDITFIENERYARMLRTSPASAAIVGPHFKRAPVETRLADDRGRRPDPGVPGRADPPGRRAAPALDRASIPQAWVAPTAEIGADVAIYPFVYVGDEAVIGDGDDPPPRRRHRRPLQARPRGRPSTPTPCSIARWSWATGSRSMPGRCSAATASATAWSTAGTSRSPRPGRVEVGDDVEIGANCTVDRATFEATRIGEGLEDRQPRHDRPQQPDRPPQPALRPGRASPAVARPATTWSWPARRGSRTTPRSATG